MTSFLLFIIFLSTSAIHGAKILAVFPFPSISHQIVFRPLTQELARRGHEVVVITTDPAFSKGQTPANLTEIDVQEVSYTKWKEAFLPAATGNKEDMFAQTMIALDMIMAIVDAQINSEQVQNMIRSNKTFDLILTEACTRPSLSFSSIYRVPVIQVSSLGNVHDSSDIIGVPSHPIIYPTIMNQKLNNLTIWDKLINIYNNVRTRFILKHREKVENEVSLKNFGPKALTVDKLKGNVNLLALNVHPIWEGNFPVPPGLVYMGGIHHKPEEELPEDLKSYLDSSQHGVIYMSFGTNTNPSLLPSDTIQMFVKVFSQLPYNVLWKWDKDELPGRTNNIRIAKWFPQADLLKHPKIKLFITQGGLQSTEEALIAEVPLIGIPMHLDQWYNVEKYLILNIGVRIDLETMTEDLLRNHINGVINEPTYKKNIARYNSLVRDQPQSPLERALWWTEHVLRHSGAAHLRAPAANISWAEYLELELLSLLFLFISFIFILLFNILIKIYCLSKNRISLWCNVAKNKNK